MKKDKLFYLLLLMMTLVGVSSCSETDDSSDTEYANWQERNETYFTNIYNIAKTNSDGTWKIIHNWSYNDSVGKKPTDNIVVKVVKAGTGSGCPMYNDSVRIHYRGRYMPTDSFPSGRIFDSSWANDYNLQTMTPTVVSPSKVVDGFATALQNMHIGDRWLVYIPYDLGYGTSSTTSIPAYSTLVFDITVVSYYRAGSDIPASKVKKGY